MTLATRLALSVAGNLAAALVFATFAAWLASIIPATLPRSWPFMAAATGAPLLGAILCTIGAVIDARELRALLNGKA